MRADTNMSWTCLILALGAAVGAPGCGDAEPDVLEVVAIADARQLSIGDRAMVEGHVTVAPGTFPGATSEQELAMQDDTAGIYVVMSEALELELDAYVRVTGTLSRLGQQRVLMAEPEDVLPLEGERAIVPTRVSTGDVDASAGSLIEVSARVTRDVEVVADLGHKVYVNDGSGEIVIFVHLVDGQPLADTSRLGTNEFVDATGLVVSVEGGVELHPRRAEDLLLQ